MVTAGQHIMVAAQLLRQAAELTQEAASVTKGASHCGASGCCCALCLGTLKDGCREEASACACSRVAVVSAARQDCSLAQMLNQFSCSPRLVLPSAVLAERTSSTVESKLGSPQHETWFYEEIVMCF